MSTHVVGQTSRCNWPPANEGSFGTAMDDGRQCPWIPVGLPFVTEDASVQNVREGLRNVIDVEHQGEAV